MSGVMLGPRAIAKLRDATRKAARLRPSLANGPTPTRGAPKDRCRVAIIGTLLAPTSTTGTPTTCVAAVLKYSVSTGKLTDSGRRITLTNFTEAFSGDDGTYGKAEWLDGVWELYYLACAPSPDLEDLPETPPGSEEPPDLPGEEPPPPPP